MSIDSNNDRLSAGINPDSGILKAMIMNHISGRKPASHWLELYRFALAESSKIHREALLLFENGFYERAYFLSMQSLEEMSKALMAADVYTGYASEDDYHKMQNDHKRKIKRVSWIKRHGKIFPIVSGGSDKVDNFDFLKKLRSTYVELEKGSNRVLSPSQAIKKTDAANLINAVMTGLSAIVETSMVNGEQIGTKGFMK